jgi:hypothetical protein
VVLFSFCKHELQALQDVEARGGEDLLLWKEMGHEAYVRGTPFFHLGQG